MNASDPVLEVESLGVSYRLRRQLLSPSSGSLHAVRGVSFQVERGEVLGLVGESGSGKSTIGRAILRLVTPATGTVRVNGTDVATARGSDLRRLRRDVQVVFQDPYSSLNSALTVGSCLVEAVRQHDEAGTAAAKVRATELLEQVGLTRAHLDRYPQEFSGGQRQRIAIARALAPGPQLLVCDEPVSALDVSTQAQVVNLLEDLQERLGLTQLFIAHDLTVVRHLSQRIAVMYLGRLVEIGPADRVYDEPAHPYTETLLAAVPDPNPLRQRARREARSGAGRASVSGIQRDLRGCPFQTRCPHVMDACRDQAPAMTTVEGGVDVACHLYAPGQARADRTIRNELAQSHLAP